MLTALFWTVTSLSFEAAGKRVGSLQVNLIRLVIAFFIYAVYLKITRGMFLPVDAGAERWLWLSLSGLVGFVIGDLLLFQAFVVVGARISMLIMSLSPPVTALISWLMLGEVLSPMNWLGMAVTLTGISLVVLKREKGSGMALRKITTAYSLKGVLLAFGGAVGQAAGLVLSTTSRTAMARSCAEPRKLMAKRWMSVCSSLLACRAVLMTLTLTRAIIVTTTRMASTRPKPKLRRLPTDNC